MSAYQFPSGIVRTATLSPCQRHRYDLSRQWAVKGMVAFVMLNPSTADGSLDDPTIRRCIRFADEWGFGGVRVFNLFTFRATDPSELDDCQERNGESAEEYLRRLRSHALVVCAWGSYGLAEARGREVVAKHLVGYSTHCLAVNADGSPRHPLYIRADARPIPWKPRTTQTEAA